MKLSTQPQSDEISGLNKTLVSSSPHCGGATELRGRRRHKTERGVNYVQNVNSSALWKEKKKKNSVSMGLIKTVDCTRAVTAQTLQRLIHTDKKARPAEQGRPGHEMLSKQSRG